jgi:hypothetical protein
MKSLAEKIKDLPQTTYAIVAKEFNTTKAYVGQIARGERMPSRGKGLQIKQALEKITTFQNYSES